jgi:single stranded DNA-binding protein
MSLNNEVRLIGNIVRDPDVYTSDRGSFSKIRMAVNTKRGENEDTLFIDVKLFGYAHKDFENNNLSKGDRVVVYGRLSIEEFVDKEQNKRKEAVVYASSIMKIAKRSSREETLEKEQF